VTALLSIDHGTTRTKAVLFDDRLGVLADGAVELTSRHPHPGWVEQDPLEIVEVTRRAVAACLAKAGPRAGDLAGIGLANQGETVVVWERASGRPAGPAIVWQDRRTADHCEALAAAGWDAEVHRRTGLRLDPYFSATKFRWVLDHVADGQARAERGELLGGTTDSWLLWRLSNGALHMTDPSTAARTLLFNVGTLDWDPVLLKLFRIPRAFLPAVVPSAGGHGELTSGALGVNRPLPVLALAVDQAAALFGLGCHHAGMAKVTYGTGAFVLMHTGTSPVFSRRGLLTTVAWRLAGPAEYALDGGVFVAGAAVQWLAEGLGVLDGPDASAAVAAAVPDSGGVVVVPALSGLAAPHWDPHARGSVFGLTLATTRAHLVRATLEGIAHRVRDVVQAMGLDTGAPLERLRVDGGASRNDVLLQIQADLLGVPVEAAAVPESTALGVAGMAGLTLGWWSPATVAAAWRARVRFEPSLSEAERQAHVARWRRALALTRRWSETPHDAGREMLQPVENA